MSTWYSKSLGDGITASMYTAAIEAAFRSSFEGAGRPAEKAVFTRHEEGALHCEVVAYFSPAAADIAGSLGAQPCKTPARQGLKLLAGVETCWRAIFPDEQ